jgi:hypothetical protein
MKNKYTLCTLVAFLETRSYLEQGLDSKGNVTALLLTMNCWTEYYDGEHGGDGWKFDVMMHKMPFSTSQFYNKLTVAGTKKINTCGNWIL